MICSFFLPTFKRPEATRGVCQQLLPLLQAGHRLQQVETDPETARQEGWFNGRVEASLDLTVMLNRWWQAERGLADLFCYLHSDMVLYDGWFDAILKGLEELPEVAVAGASYWPTPQPPSLPGKPFDESYWDTRDRLPVETCAVANAMKRRAREYSVGARCPRVFRGAALDEVGGWDERFIGFGGYDDFDIDRRILLAGHKIVTFHGAVVWHRGMGARGTRWNNALHVLNKNRFKAKWNIALDKDITQYPAGPGAYALDRPGWTCVKQDGADD